MGLANQMDASTRSFSMDYSEKVVKLCAEKDWDQADLWRAVHKKVSRTTVSNWFNGLSRPDMDTALGVARALGVPLDYLADDSIDGPPPSSSLPEDEANLLRVYRSLKRTNRINEDKAVDGLMMVASGPVPSSSDDPWAGPQRDETESYVRGLRDRQQPTMEPDRHAGTQEDPRKGGKKGGSETGKETGRKR